MSISPLDNNNLPVKYPLEIDDIKPDVFSFEYFTKESKNAPLLPCLGFTTEQVNGIAKNLFIKFHVPTNCKTNIKLKTPSHSPLILSSGILRNRIKNTNEAAEFSQFLENGENYFTLSLVKDYKNQSPKPISTFKIRNKTKENKENFKFKIKAYGHNFSQRNPTKIRNPHIPLVKVLDATTKCKTEAQSTTTPTHICSPLPTVHFFDPTSDRFLYEILESW